jgi:hypothetical protein
VQANGNAVTGADTQTTTETSSDTLNESASEGTLGAYTLSKTGGEDSTTTKTGNDVTGTYVVSGSYDNSSTAIETINDPAQQATFTEILAESGTNGGSGNDVTGDYTLTQTGGSSANFADRGTDPIGSFNVTEGSTETFVRGTIGNQPDGSYTQTDNSTDNYSMTQVVSGSNSFTLTESGTDGGTSTESGNQVTGDYTIISGGTDSYTLQEQYQNSGQFTTVTGTDTYSGSESGNHAAQTYNRTTSGGGNYVEITVNGTRILGTNAYTLVEAGDARAGHFSQVKYGTDRYGLLPLFNDVSNAVSGASPGNVTFHSHGLPFRDPSFGDMVISVGVASVQGALQAIATGPKGDVAAQLSVMMMQNAMNDWSAEAMKPSRWQRFKGWARDAGNTVVDGLRAIGNAITAALDFFSGGLFAKARQALGIDWADYNSAAYKFGYGVGIAVAIAIPVLGVASRIFGLARGAMALGSAATAARGAVAAAEVASVARAGTAAGRAISAAAGAVTSTLATGARLTGQIASTVLRVGGVGAAIGMGSLFATDVLIKGELSGWQDYLGAAVGGVATIGLMKWGWAARNLGWFGTGALGSVAGTATKQLANWEFNGYELLGSALGGGVGSWVGGKVLGQSLSELMSSGGAGISLGRVIGSVVAGGAAGGGAGAFTGEFMATLVHTGDLGEALLAGFKAVPMGVLSGTVSSLGGLGVGAGIHYAGEGLGYIGKKIGEAACLAKSETVRSVANAVSDFLGLAKSCFAAGTPLRTPEGWKRIEQFRVGDLVLSRDETNPEGLVSVQTVEAVFARGSLLWRLQAGGRDIGTTAEHPFYVKGKGWTPVNRLAVGDLLLCEDGLWVYVDAVEATAEWAKVYNLRVSDFHTYFVGTEEWGFAVWAHNAVCTPNDVQTAIEKGTNYTRAELEKGIPGLDMDAVLHEIARLSNEGHIAQAMDLMENSFALNEMESGLAMIELNNMLNQRDRASGSPIRVAAMDEADRVQANTSARKAPECVAVFDQGGVRGVGRSAKRDPNNPAGITPRVKKLYDDVPKDQQSGHHLECAEPDGLSDLDRQGATLEGARMSTSIVGPKCGAYMKHGLFKPLCTSCDYVARALKLIIENQ